MKTALKLLLVFVEFTESNCLLLIQAVETVDIERGNYPFVLYQVAVGLSERLTPAGAGCHVEVTTITNA